MCFLLFLFAIFLQFLLHNIYSPTALVKQNNVTFYLVFRFLKIVITDILKMPVQCTAVQMKFH